MTTRLVLTSVAMFVLGFGVGFHFGVELYRFLAPERWNELRLTATIDRFAIQFWSGVGVGCLFESAPIAVWLSAHRAAWLLQMAAYLAGSSLVSLAAARFGAHVFYSGSSVLFFPLCGATASLLFATALRGISHARRQGNSAPNVTR